MNFRIAISFFVFAFVIPSTRADAGWIVGTENSAFYFAANLNDAAHLLGQYCYFDSGSCYYTVVFNEPCEIGGSYPVLVSTEELGAEHMNLICSRAPSRGNQYLLVIDNFDVIDRFVRGASKIGFAMPLNSDQFKVSRFDLSGAAHAIDKMRAAAERKAGAMLKRGNLPAEAFM